ncbi:MAG: 2-dehydro-3-deoxygalactonokinase [Lautropia sp.]
MPTTADPTVIALDWGTSNLRAFLIDAGGGILAQRERPWGILSLPKPAADGGFDDALDGIAGDWLAAAPAATVIASGMVGSAQGWHEAAYLPCPVDAERLAARLTTFATRSGRPLAIVPGLLQDAADALPDVMRGEETQVFGALGMLEAAERTEAAGGACCFVLPGTHSKWVAVRDRRIERFATCMTGELYAVLRQHSILGRLMPSATGSAGATGTTGTTRSGASAAADRAVGAAAFDQALALARDSRPGELVRQLFTVRSMRLAGRLPAAALPDYLSGLLIGHELTSMTHDFAGAERLPLVLIGEPALTARYRTAFAAFGLPVTILENTAAAGLFAIARQSAGGHAVPAGHDHRGSGRSSGATR